uniref:Peptidase_M13_N domain-containing protein n=1 Tax=Schistosoma mansoni TaxID=6183 RepID=A0A5K4F8K3_SCHMA
MILKNLSKRQKLILSILVIGAICASVVLTIFLVRHLKSNTNNEDLSPPTAAPVLITEVKEPVKDEDLSPPTAAPVLITEVKEPVKDEDLSPPTAAPVLITEVKEPVKDEDLSPPTAAPVLITEVKEPVKGFVDQPDQFACVDYLASSCLEQFIDGAASHPTGVDDDFIINLMNNTNNPDDSRFMSAVNYYKSCTDSPNAEISVIENEVIKLIITLFKGWYLTNAYDKIPFTVKRNLLNDETFSLTSLFLPLLLQSGSTTLFSLKLVNDGNPSIDISLGSLEAFDAVAPSMSDGKKINAAEQLFAYLKKLGPLKDKKNIIKDVLQLHSQIKSAIQPSGSVSKVTIEKLSEICPLIDWNVLFESIFRELKYESYKNMEIIVHDQDSLRKVCDIHATAMETNNGRKNLHAMTTISFLFNMKNILNRYYSEFYPSTIHDGCLFDHMRIRMIPLEELFLSHAIGIRIDNDCVLQMFEELKTTLSDSLSSMSWLKEDEKKNYINLANSFQLSIITSKSLSAEDRESRDFIFTNEISEDDYFMNVYYSQKTKFLKSIYKSLDTNAEPDAFTFMPYISGSAENKLIKISAGLLNPPYLKEGYSMSEKYGTIGWFIGRQLMYEVNNNKEEDNHGNSQSSCMSEEATDSEAQICCLQEQDSFKDYNKTDLRSLSADINGLMLSFKTYASDGDLDGKKLFFSSFAKMMCTRYSADVITTNLQSSNSRYKFSVNEILKHSQEFSNIHRCSSGSKMNPENKCLLWSEA